MARRSTASTPAAPERSEAVNLDPTASANLASAFRFGHEVFGARVENWVLDRENGTVVAEGYSVATPHDPQMVIDLFSNRKRRPSLFPTLNYVEGQSPAPYSNGQLIELTQDTQQFGKMLDEEGNLTIPEWVDEAIKTYRSANGLTGKRGSGRKNFNVDNLGDITVDDISGLTEEAILHLANVAQEAQELRASTGNPSDEAVAVSA